MTVSPLISAVIPTLNRPRELRLCLDGFSRQSAPLEQFEVVIVDDGSTEDIASVAAEFENRIQLRFLRRDHAGLSAARNAGIEAAQAPLLILYDDDVRPLPCLVAQCLEFHREHPADGDAELLQFGLEPEIARSPLARWCFDHCYPFPPAPGPQHLSCFWGGAVTCKRDLFRYGLFDPAYLSVEDAEFASRISQRVDLRVHFRGHICGMMTRAITLRHLCRREYLRGYFQFNLEQDHPAIWSFPQEPENLLPPDELRITFATASGMAQIVNPSRSALLAALCHKLVQHSKSSGWIAARDGRPCDPSEAAPHL
jgi:glycosyltransferase involved in cell wall biosynthesis